MTTATPKAPVECFRFHSVSLSIFENEGTVDGKTQTFFRAKVDRRYRDNKSGQWNSSNSFSADELLRLQHLISRAVDFMSSKHSESQ